MGEQPDQIRQEIDATRAQMGDTLEALSYKTDVAARVGDAASERVETTYGLLSNAVSQASGAATAAATAASAAAARANAFIASNPLAVALAALSVFAAGGLLAARRRG